MNEFCFLEHSINRQDSTESIMITTKQIIIKISADILHITPNISYVIYVILSYNGV